MAAIILAAGRGTRAGGTIPKQWQSLGGKPVVAHALKALMHPEIGLRVLVHHPDDLEQAQALNSDAILVAGGAERDASVKAGLLALQGRGVSRVLIHDGARPFPGRVIGDLLAALDHAPAAAPGLVVSDALWRVDGGLVTGLQDRAGLVRGEWTGGHAPAPLRCGEVAGHGRLAVPGCAGFARGGVWRPGYGQK